MTSETSTQTKRKADVLERFSDFCRRRSKRQMSEKTLTRYLQVIDTLNRKHGLSLEVVDIGEVERVVTERAKVLSPATFNTEAAAEMVGTVLCILNPRCTVNSNSLSDVMFSVAFCRSTSPSKTLNVYSPPLNRNVVIPLSLVGCRTYSREPFNSEIPMSVTNNSIILKLS